MSGTAPGIRRVPSRRCGCDECRKAKPVPERKPTKACTARWQFRWYDAAGQRHSATRRTLAEAKDAKAAAEAASTAGTYLDPKRGQITLAAWREMWLEGRTVERATAARNQRQWSAHVGPRWGHLPLAGISHQDVQTWVTGLGRRGLAHATIDSMLTLLGMMLEAARLDKRIQFNPCDHVSPGKPARRHPDEERPPTREQVLAACARIEYGPYRRLPEFILETGLRWGEAVGLLPDCVDRDAGVLRVRRVVEEVEGRKVLREYPKSEAGYRTLPLTRRACELLDEQDAEQPFTPSLPVFRGRFGALLGRNNYRSRVWLPATIAAGIHREQLRPSGTLEHWPTIHDLRHTWATMLENGGVSRATLKELLGHARPQSDVTWRYTHGASEVRDLVLRALGDLPQEPPERRVKRLKKVRRRIPNVAPSQLPASESQYLPVSDRGRKAARQ